VGLLRVWSHYTDSINTILGECFRALLEIGSANPDYVSSDPAHWSYEFLHPHVSDIVDYVERSFLPTYTVLLDDKSETIASLLTDFYVGVDNRLSRLISEAIVQLARQGWKKPGSAPSTREATPEQGVQATGFGLRLRFALPDLEDPPVGTPRNEIVRYLHQHLKQGIHEARAWRDLEDREGRKPSTEEIAARFPILQAANSSELQYIMVGRTLLPLETITRYLRPMRKRTHQQSNG